MVLLLFHVMGARTPTAFPLLQYCCDCHRVFEALHGKMVSQNGEGTPVIAAVHPKVLLYLLVFEFASIRANRIQSASFFHFTLCNACVARELQIIALS